MPLSELSRHAPCGTPYLCPQVVLLYKAKNPRPTDHEDFERTLPMLNAGERCWLVEALEICHPGYEWLRKL